VSLISLKVDFDSDQSYLYVKEQLSQNVIITPIKVKLPLDHGLWKSYHIIFLALNSLGSLILLVYESLWN
jgi:hypothetical protein